jgi:hypothetical protein
MVWKDGCQLTCAFLAPSKWVRHRDLILLEPVDALIKKKPNLLVVERRALTALA